MVMRILTICVALAGAMGCTPLTFTKQDTVAFSAYPLVRVEVWVGSYEDVQATEYFAQRLRESSGFDEVIYGPRLVADAVLVVDVEVSQIDDEEFEAHARYRLFDDAERIVDSGEVKDDGSQSGEAAFDAMDEVVLHYHRAYRI